jgi:hypothetical protein
MKPTSNNLAISFFITFFLYWVKQWSRCLIGLDFGLRCSSCKNFPIFLEEFDKREFLFGIQTIAHVSNHGRLLREQWDFLAQ